MPSRENIEKFTHALDALGAWAENRPPKEDTGEETPPQGEDLPPDIGELLGSDGIEPPREETPAAAGEEAPQDQDALAGIDFGSLLGEESAAPHFEDLHEAAPGGQAAPEAPIEAASEASFELPASGELGADLEGMELLPEDFGPTDTAAPAPPGEPPERPSDDFLAAMESPPTPSTEESARPETEDFEIPILGEGPIEGFETPSEAPPVDETAPHVPEGIELPSFEEMSLTEEAQPTTPAPLPEEPAPPPPFEEGTTPLSEGFGLGEEGEATPPGGGEAEEPRMESIEEKPDELGLDEFTLPESVEEFGISAKPVSAAKPGREAPRAAPPRAKPGMEAVEELGAPEVEISLTEEQFSRLKRSLNSLPRNLKIAVEELVSGGVPTPDLKALVGLLVGGASAGEIAALTGRITGKRIRLPAGFEKKSGIAFEAERLTFAYALRENILPIFRVFALTAAGFALFAFLGYRYVYRPMYAYMSYRSGYEHLQSNRFELANQGFDRGTSVWPMKGWFYRYAEGFRDRSQYILAEEKYESLLQRWPGDKKGILDYARMLSTRLLDYKRADDLLKRILDVQMYDYDALLASGDNDMQWAAEDQTRYEEARIAYASLIEKFGERGDLLFRMLRYFIRTDKYEEAEKIRAYFASRKDVKVDPEAYAELGGYLVDKDQLTYAQDVLFEALDVKPDLPQIHYNLARYYRVIKDPVEEKKALDGTLANLKPTDVLTRERISMEIDTHTRLGELYYGERQELNAEKELKTAIGLVEKNQDRKLIATGRIFGQPYHDLGDLAYYTSGDLNQAHLLYTKAIENGFDTTEMDYKIAYIHYAQEDYKAALDGFTATADQMPPARIPPNLLYAIGNTFYLRTDYFAAQGYYLRLMDFLNDKRAGIANLQIQEQPEHRALVEYMLNVGNNLGVATYQLSKKTGDTRKRSEALVYLATATEQYDTLSRDPETLRRPETRNLPSLNMRGILYPAARFDPQIYILIPKDLEATFF